jgi:hypothetical protein
MRTSATETGNRDYLSICNSSSSRPPDGNDLLITVFSRSYGFAVMNGLSLTHNGHPNCAEIETTPPICHCVCLLPKRASARAGLFASDLASATALQRSFDQQLDLHLFVHVPDCINGLDGLD